MEYVLGHTDAELRRLSRQARLIDPITRRFFESAGIAEGMRVLDVGSGAGDVAVLIADLVGPSGEVVGTDLAAIAIDTARRRVSSAGLRNVSFRQGDPAEMTFEASFDAVVGRYVLQFLSDPAAALQRIVRHLKPNGRIAFHELDWDGTRSAPPAPTYDRLCGLVSRTIEGSGAEAHLGTRLAAVFQAAGLPSPTLRLEAVIASGPAVRDAALLVCDLVETLLPAMERLGIATTSGLNHPFLADRIMAEVGVSGTLIGRAEVGAWCVVQRDEDPSA